MSRRPRKAEATNAGDESGNRQAMEEARAALRMIREAVEMLGPPGTMASEEAVNALRGPGLMGEAEEIVAGIRRIAHSTR